MEPGILVVDSHLRIVSANPAGVRLASLPAVEPQSIFSIALPSPLESVVRSVLREGAASPERLVSFPSQADGPVTVRATAFPWQSTAGDPTAALVILQDLSSARELEALTERVQKLATVGTLSAGVAHEIKNALVAVKTFVELLLEKQPNSDAASLVRCEVGRIDLLVSQLLRFAGPSQGSCEPVSLHELLRNALRLVQPQFQANRIEASLLLQAGNDCVNADARQLEQAFLNLLLNAVEAMSEGGQLVLRTEVVVATEHISRFEPHKREPQIQLEIQDSGPGIPPEILPRLFSPFVTSKAGGTGLGLAITRRIISEHHGSIRVETKHDRGTIFRIVLPLLRAPAASGK